MKALFIHQKLMPFVEKDLNIVKGKYDVKEIRFRKVRTLFKLWQGVRWCDISFSWFGKLHAFFAVLFSKILGKKSIVVAGGDDVAYEPEIRYGMFSFWWKKWCPLFVFRYADLILCVSQFNKLETIKNARANPKRIGLISHGFDANKFRRIPEIEKETITITVGRITPETVITKGLKIFVESAEFLPNVKFILVGPSKGRFISHLRSIARGNVEIIDWLCAKDLVRMYNRAKVYVQVSRHESFGCSLAEAMLCECIPVVSRKGAIPELVGNCGVYVDNPTPERVAEKIKEALSLSEDWGRKARRRVITLFPLEKRKRELLRAIDEVWRT